MSRFWLHSLFWQCTRCMEGKGNAIWTTSWARNLNGSLRMYQLGLTRRKEGESELGISTAYLSNPENPWTSIPCCPSSRFCQCYWWALNRLGCSELCLFSAQAQIPNPSWDNQLWPDDWAFLQGLLMPLDVKLSSWGTAEFNRPELRDSKIHPNQLALG